MPLTAKIYSNIEFSRLKQEKNIILVWHDDSRIKTGKILWKICCHGSYFIIATGSVIIISFILSIVIFFHRRKIVNTKYSQQKHKIKPSMLNSNLTQVTIFLKRLTLATWSPLKLLAIIFFAQHLLSRIFSMLFYVKFGC